MKAEQQGEHARGADARAKRRARQGHARRRHAVL
jgi:hypothetical protein